MRLLKRLVWGLVIMAIASMFAKPRHLVKNVISARLGTRVTALHPTKRSATAGTRVTRGTRLKRYLMGRYLAKRFGTNGSFIDRLLAGIAVRQPAEPDGVRRDNDEEHTGGMGDEARPTPPGHTPDGEQPLPDSSNGAFVSDGNTEPTVENTVRGALRTGARINLSSPGATTSGRPSDDPPIFAELLKGVLGTDSEVNEVFEDRFNSDHEPTLTGIPVIPTTPDGHPERVPASDDTIAAMAVAAEQDPIVPVDAS